MFDWWTFCGSWIGCLLFGRLFRHPLASLAGVVVGAWAAVWLRKKLGIRPGRRARRGRTDAPRDPLWDAYATLGVSPSAGDEEIRRAYRKLAKENHPDLLRARGLSESAIAKATAKMGRINAAWSLIRESRGI